MIRPIRTLFLLLGLLLVAVPAVAQTKPYLDEDLSGQVLRLGEKLHKDKPSLVGQPSGPYDSQAQMALSGKDYEKALAAAKSAVTANGRDALAWRLLSQAAQGSIDPNNYSTKYDLQELAEQAAYGAYEQSKTSPDKASALALLGSAYAQAQSWRASLNAYRASLDLNADSGVQSTYEDLREKYGFQIKDYTVDSDAAAPKVCFQFSETLSRATPDFSSFVAVSSTQGGTSVSAEDTQLCVNGLKHGERYAIVIRQGLPSDVGEALLKSADYEIYVRDRSPSVRFTGRNYVLPKTGQQGLPVVSVNTTSVDLQVYRIGDRSLLPTVHSDDFLEQLSGSSADTIAKEKGEKIWSGTMATKSDLNQDVTTDFPVTEAIPQMKPGVYVMFADVTGAKKQNSDDEEVDYETRTTQWFVVSDIGLTAFTGDDGVHVLVRSLATAEPMGGIEVKLLAKDNEILDTKTSDAKGEVDFDAGLARGKDGNAPAMLNVSDGKGDYGFLDLSQTAFDLTDRGVKGRVAPGPLDAFAYTERGVYRSGETVYVTSLLRDAAGNAVAGLPLTFVVTRPDGVEYRRSVIQDSGLGGHVLSVPLINSSQSGTWHVNVYSDPKRPAIGSTSFLVEDYVPERLDLTLKSTADYVHPGEPATIKVSAHYLYGTAGSDLDVSADYRIEAADEIAVPALKGYKVGLTDTAFETVTGQMDENGTTDENGNAEISVPLQETEALRPLQATIGVSVSESGGRAITREVKVPIVPKGSLIGIKPLFGPDDLTEGSQAAFETVMVDSSGKRIARPGVRWTLSRIDNNYQWFFKNGHWNFEAVKINRTVATGTVDMSDTAVAKISAPVQLGEYRLDLVAEGVQGAQSSSTFYVGWGGDVTANTPDVLDMRLDKPSYTAGDTVTVKMRPHFGVKVDLAVISDKLQMLQEVDVPASGGEASLTVKPEWGAGAYVVALAHRPLDTAAQRAPGRAIGVAWFAIEHNNHALNVALTPPQTIKPRGTLDIPVKLDGLNPGEEAYVVVSAVDVGILNLTRYQTPDVSGYFFGQRQLALELRDLYGYLIDGMQGTRGAIHFGGDNNAPTTQGPPPIFEPLARYSGPVKVGSDGTAHVSFDIPAFNGKVRVVGVAYSQTRVGQTETDVIIHDPIVLQGTLPRFLSLGDQSRFHIAIDNVDAPDGDYVLDVDVKGPVTVPVDTLHRTIHLGKGQKSAVTIPVTAAGLGTATFDLHLTGGAVDLGQTMVLKVESTNHMLVNRQIQSLNPGGSVTLSDALFSNLLPDSGTLSLSVTLPYTSIDVPNLLLQLDRYPYGCTEQTVSRAMPLLYVNRLEAQEQFRLDAGADDRVRGALDRVLAREDANGTFGLWGVGGEDVWLDAFAADFLTRAKEKNFAVPNRGLENALDHLRNSVVNVSSIKPEESAGIAYATYVLARNGRPIIGDLRYMADTKLDDFASPLAKAELAAGLALLGDKGRSTKAFATAIQALDAEKDDGYSRYDYGSKVRDAAGILALLAESGGAHTDVVRVSSILDSARDNSRYHYTTTQEQNWMVIAAQALSKDANTLDTSVDGDAKKGVFYRNFTEAKLQDKPVVVTNQGADPARLVLAVSGVPVAPEPAVEQGFKVERTIHAMNGDVVEPSQLKQNERYIISLRVTEKESHFGRLLLVDPLAAGLEIDNPSLVADSVLPDADWLKQAIEPVNSEYRDDRFVAAFNREPDNTAVYSVAYIVRAVSPGKYVHPGATIEDMYRPERFARSAFDQVEISAAK
ncbi:alpha-2-macroglobulin family protein [Methylovirgula sp. 4M-Z18]|uniref:alpha-2-macroglobulin family protein n=1 Tax=Methylovirgula sp. 4M-Z18 TaxID=2293567 RepID=UPI000E2E96FF|nr:alpha-2-macroglobulin [Methylovirgula sp. 4M-Z18]RFB79054.1 alpha-2-macroglobulin family protein [Methylovirgula sp. 4M-Z18]